MNHSLHTLFSVSAIALCAISAVHAEDKVVNVYNWSDYIDESTLAEFEEKTGIKVVYDVFDSNEVLETKMLAGGSGYDIVVPTGSFLARQIQAGAFRKLDKDKLPNLENMWQQISDRTAAYDPDNTYSINYMWGTTGIGYNVDMIKERMPDAPLDSWAMIFDPAVISKFKDCGIHILDAPAEIIPTALKYIGEDPDTDDAKVIAKAEETLMVMRENTTKFHSSEYINALANGDICLAVGWSGDVLQARDRAAEAGNDVKVEYVIPKEGALMWFDQMAIPVDAPHPDNAHAFLNFMMDPQIMARNSNYVYYANGNKASQPLLNEDVIGDPAIYPPESTVEQLFTKTPYSPRTQRTVTRMWTRIVSGH
ncbi:polyamine ABC transporter substrate-binding protein [Granulosicoccaceae sp. 1_MG-2023]|nr:polyamine ABC transporter substrate-binding protein [Granulosicoccaceae sp. 1_MG-2023]